MKINVLTITVCTNTIIKLYDPSLCSRAKPICVEGFMDILFTTLNVIKLDMYSETSPSGTPTFFLSMDKSTRLFYRCRRSPYQIWCHQVVWWILLVRGHTISMTLITPWLIIACCYQDTCSTIWQLRNRLDSKCFFVTCPLGQNQATFVCSNRDIDI